MRLTSIFMLLFFTTACQTMKPYCNDTRKAADIAAPKIANVLGCSRPENIAKDLVAKIEEAKLCEEREQGALQDAICRPVAAFIADRLVSKLPSSWECNGGTAKQATVNTVYLACVQGNVL